MSTFLLSLHVLAAILAVGPVTVAASMFPAAVRRVPVSASAGGGAGGAADAGDVRTVRLLHRVCRVYAGLGIAQCRSSASPPPPRWGSSRTPG